MKGSSKIIVVFVCLLACVSMASAVRTGPIPIGSGNTHCDDIGYPGPSLILNGPNSQSGSNLDGFSVTTTVISDQNINWNSNFAVNAILVHSNSYNEYTYNPGQTSDTGLAAPSNPGTQIHLDRIEFCYSSPNGIPTPEFPTMALPFSMIIGIAGLVYLVKGRDT
jgi:hypothetical protein